ncbi:MAG TPA: glycosyltransferase 87 family protein [Anaerolineales bacterium]|nr:glycosyltransferase 87 family protein [Anaerolineales bacterium]
MGTLNYRRILAIAGAVSLLFYYSFYWMNMLADSDQRTGSDFMGVYIFGRITQTIGIQHLYDIAEHQRIEEQVVGHPVTPIFYTHLPFTAPLAAAIVDEDYLVSFKRWALLLLLLNALSVSVLVNLVNIKRFTRENGLILILGAFFFDPTASGFMNGQDTALLLLGAVLWLWGMISGKYFLAGLGLSLTTVRPQMALFLAIPFLFKERKVFWGFVLGSSILAGISIGLLKIDGTLKFIESLRYIESTIWVEPHSFDMPTISGIIRRNFEVTNPIAAKSFVWMCYLIGIACFSVWWYRSHEITERHIGLLALLAILLIPYAHYHELTLLLIPIFCLIRMLQKNGAVEQYYLAVLPLVVSWLSALGFIGSGVMKFPIVYSVMITLAYLLLTHGKVLQNNPQLAVEG